MEGRIIAFAAGGAHSRGVIRTTPSMRSFLAVLLFAALAVRAIIPAGWMPSSERAFAITVCTGIDTKTIWLDRQGKTHKQDPAHDKGANHAPCAFAGMAMASDVPVPVAFELLAPSVTVIPRLTSANVTVGQGLAAPPPPSTGPPILI